MSRCHAAPTWQGWGLERFIQTGITDGSGIWIGVKGSFRGHSCVQLGCIHSADRHQLLTWYQDSNRFSLLPQTQHFLQKTSSTRDAGRWSCLQVGAEALVTHPCLSQAPDCTFKPARTSGRNERMRYGRKTLGCVLVWWVLSPPLTLIACLPHSVGQC